MPTRKLPNPTAPEKLLNHLFAIQPEMKRTRVKELLQSGLVHVNGESVIRHDHLVGPHDLIEVRSERVAPPRKLPFPVLYEDSSIIVIDKPSGLLTIATQTEKTKTVYSIINAALAHTRERAFVVHRLDRDTSGVLILAKDEDIKHKVMGNWKAARKTYFALVEGTPKVKKQRLRHFLREDENLVVHAYPNQVKQSQEAILSYSTVSSGPTYSLLQIELDTGRKNQIRAQLRAIGNSIAGDEKYGATTDPIGRLCLHAAKLSIPHPETGKMMTFEVPIPEEMKKAAKL